MLTVEKLKRALVYDPATGLFTRLHSRRGDRIGTKADNSLTTAGYARVSVGNRWYLAHRLAWFWVYGEWPPGFVDHINLDKKDNRISNLREASFAENSANALTRCDNTSGYRGVSFDRQHKKWHAYINKHGKRTNLGLFNSAEDAFEAYRKAAVRVFGDFCPLHLQGM